MARNPYALKIPVGMTDWIILIARPEGRLFRRTVQRLTRGVMQH